MFYKHPPAEAYGLNKLLFESRHSQDLRLRIINDFERVCDQYELHGQQREAAKSIINVGKRRQGQRPRRAARRRRCHPLQALMALHVIFSTSHARGQAAMAGGAKH